MARGPELPEETRYTFLLILYFSGDNGSITVYFTITHHKKNT